MKFVVVGHGDGGAPTEGLVTRTAGQFPAMHGAVAGQEAVDLLEDVDLTAAGPVGSVAHAVAEKPEGRPHALLAGLRVGAQADGGLDARRLARLRGERGPALDAARGPLARGGLARHELDGAAARDLEVAVRGGVDLGFVVGVDAGGRGKRGQCRGRRGIGKEREVEGLLQSYLPQVGGRCTGGAGEGVLPDHIEARVCRGGAGKDEAGKERKDSCGVAHDDGEDCIYTTVYRQVCVGKVRQVGKESRRVKAKQLSGRSTGTTF